ncbi:DNA processing single strand binding protein [Candidatus Terasakiella magnetica]|uniref:DNA processing single strand binding protein n=1 Tax=Candidatus Terasakiella magnetica TaxID=1867952 RepID=A0A1C3RJX7_9PROT|nr:DNA-processing protein DprA [Candidatus Terasakiella magnetica]SCA57576.1 DNA processing single strand binding protein [Candidatus Terasakiella magnetica]
MSHTISQEERIAWLRLIRSENVGPITFYRLLEQFGSAQKALEAIPDMASRGGRKKAIKVCSKSEAVKELEELDDIDAQLIVRDEAAYPPLLAQVEDAPPVLSLRGHAHLMTKKSIAIVGARNASINGCKFAAQLARELGQGGLLVVSGLARGVDGAAHAASLETGTVGVQGGGVDVIYPKENHSLYKEMIQRGCVIAEPKISTQPQARHFPRRNRIISGMCRAIIVVEASPRSGSLISARMALEQGREVFAVPGSPLDPRSKGTNALIRDGAHLVENAENIFQVLNSLQNLPLQERKTQYYQEGMVSPPGEDELVDARTIITKSLSVTAVCVDEIIRQCQISASVVQTVLLELELAGQLERHPGNKVSLII